MNKLIYIFVSLLLCISFSTYAQEYFQQEVNYRIEVKLDDENHSLSAYEEIEYINNSPENLEFIYFHIWPNAYDNNETALAKQKFESGGKRKFFRVEEQRGYIDSLDFKVNGKPVNWEYDEQHIDICKIFLDQPLKSGQSIIINTPFRVKIPKGVTSRLGHIDQSYQITQWYPKPAVYDKFGWHQMPYLSMGEFYSEFGSFDVSITVPDNYIVAATGNLQNEDEIARLKKNADETGKMEEFDMENKEFPPSEKEFKTLRFTESNIHDFAWFADKRFHVLKSKVQLPHSGRTVNTWAFFPNHNADLWEKATEYINDALYYYSFWYGDYPYDNCSAVHAPISAGGGMEYPTITVISGSPTAMMLEMVIMHEVGHNWFYGILGSDEREHPWMDEGINTFSEMRYFRTKYPDNRLYKMLFKKEKPAKLLGIEDLKYKSFHETDYLLNARRNLDQPLSLHTDDYSFSNYGGMVYSKAGIVFTYLLDYLGEEKFNEIMQDYYETWKYKHPYPEDLQKIFEKHVNEDLSWFFDDLFQTTKKIDYKICRLKQNKVLIKNKGQITCPLSIYGLDKDTVVFHEWHDGFNGKEWLTLSNTSEIDFLTIDHPGNIPELYKQNNYLRTSGIFKRTKPLNLGLIGLIEKPNQTRINILPAAGWNYYNKFMLGGLLYSSLLPQPRFEYQLMPMYSFGSNDLAGMGKIRHNILPYKSVFQSVSVYLSGKQFAYEDKSGSYFQKLKAGIDFRFRRKIMKKPIDNYLRLNFIFATSMYDLTLDQDKNFKQYYNIQYRHKNARRINPYGLLIDIQASDDFVKGTLEAKYKIHYIYKKSLDIRLFGGTFFYKAEDLPGLYDFRVSGSTGYQDYTYDNLFFARFEDAAGKNFLSNQFVGNDGGFAVYTPLGQTDEWMLALNLTSSLPIPKKIPLQVYANVATFGKTLSIADWETPESFFYEAGAKVYIIRNVFEFYFPVLMSDDLQKYSDEITDNYWQKIRFTLYLNKLNIFEIARNL
ncbi:MAG: M1 family metallopeptidase [Bacteroidetes bacterium]|nr:M1 family metallopeptidase [Bacteroidota bacterium]MBL7104963.1 M1 family metallopeptidase [Bacteroidales bacterium]